MSRKTLIDYMVKEALEEDSREGSHFDKESFGNFFPEYRSDAAGHDVEWDDDIWDEAFSAYMQAPGDKWILTRHIPTSR
jgi:hypothetical protein